MNMNAGGLFRSRQPNPRCVSPRPAKEARCNDSRNLSPSLFLLESKALLPSTKGTRPAALNFLCHPGRISRIRVETFREPCGRFRSVGPATVCSVCLHQPGSNFALGLECL